MEIEGFSEIVDTVSLAKFLHDIGRFDIVKEQFSDLISCDSWMENMWGVITFIFSGFNNYCDYDDCGETEKMIFTDDVISNYFIHAWEYGKKTDTPHEKNEYVIEAEHEVRRRLNYTYNMNWKLLAYTKTKKAAGKSKLIIYTCVSEFYEYDYLAYGLVHLYKWFKDKCASFADSKEVKEV